jgi:hypothetical protein
MSKCEDCEFCDQADMQRSKMESGEEDPYTAKNLEKLRQWAADLESENGSAAGLLSWAAFEIVNIREKTLWLRRYTNLLQKLAGEIRLPGAPTYDACVMEAIRIIRWYNEY